MAQTQKDTDLEEGSAVQNLDDDDGQEQEEEEEGEENEEVVAFSPEASTLPSPANGDEGEENEEVNEENEENEKEEVIGQEEEVDQEEEGENEEVEEEEEEEEEVIAETDNENGEDTIVQEEDNEEDAAEEIDQVLTKTMEELRQESQFMTSQRTVEDGGVNVGNLEVQLTFDLGDITLTLKDLEAMKAGYVLPMEHPLDDVVHIRANGHLIGRGRLVKIEDRLGVQIEELRGGSVDVDAR
jgi:flagellar motor switch/type III secretory pathway protein FliN